MRLLHGALRPRTYLEICSGEGNLADLSEARTAVLNVGPRLAEGSRVHRLPNLAALLQMPSQDALHGVDLSALLGGPIDLALIDGVHLCEVVLREFAAIEAAATPTTVILLHDCLPVEAAIAARQPPGDDVIAPHRRNWWLGDVWRVALFLRRNRPDLVLRALDSHPSGLLCVANCDSRRALGPAELEAATREMLGYDLAQIGIDGLFAELRVEPAAALSADTDFAAWLRPEARGPSADETGAIVRHLGQAEPHGLEVAVLGEAVLQAFRGSVLAFEGGPSIAAHPALQPLRHFRGQAPVDRFEPRLTLRRRLAGEYIYGGPLYFHFGHFMAEMAHRIVPSHQSFGAKPFVFLGNADTSTKFDDLPGWMRGILGALGLTERNVLIVNEDCAVERLHIAQQGACLGREPLPGYLRLLHDFWQFRAPALGPATDVHRRIYVSRSKIEHGGNFLGEFYIDELFRRAGYHVMHPERLDFARQMELYLHAEELVFCEGSSCHGCELVGAEMLGRVMLVGKREISTFTNVLRPRSRAFFVQDGNFTLGSLVRDEASDEPLLYLGLHLLRIPRFFETLRSAGFADLAPFFDADAYRRAVQSDLFKYIAHYFRQRPSQTRPADVAELVAQFERMLPESLEA